VEVTLRGAGASALESAVCSANLSSGGGGGWGMCELTRSSTRATTKACCGCTRHELRLLLPGQGTGGRPPFETPQRAPAPRGGRAGGAWVSRRRCRGRQHDMEPQRDRSQNCGGLPESWCTPSTPALHPWPVLGQQA